MLNDNLEKQKIMAIKKKTIISIILIIIALPLAIATASGGVGPLAYLFAIILAYGVDMLFDRIQSGKAKIN